MTRGQTHALLDRTLRFEREIPALVQGIPKKNRGYDLLEWISPSKLISVAQKSQISTTPIDRSKQ
jgi:hypothetical protein